MKQKTEKIMMDNDTKQVNFLNKERKHSLASQAGHSLRYLLEMIPAMIIPMLYRLDIYTGRAGHMAHAHH